MAPETGPIVLVVESESDQAAWTKEVLEAEGFRVMAASDGAQALSTLDVIRPEVVIADMVMPVLDGLAFLRRWRERPAPRPPVIAVSALASYLPAAMGLGATVALLKPWDRERLVAWVRSISRGQPAPRPVVPRPGPDELARLRSIEHLDLDRPATGPALARFVERVARVFDVPICLVSTVTRDRQYWSVACGLPPDLDRSRGTPRSQSFCTHSVAARAPLVVQDAYENPFFRDNTLVVERGLRFYAGVPLFDRRGEALGTLCLLDVKERPTFGHFDLALLGALSTRVMGELEWRERCRRPDEPSSAFRYLGAVDRELSIFGRGLFEEVLRIQASRMADARRRLAVAVVAFAGGRRREGAGRIEAGLDGALLGRLGLDRVGVLVPDLATEEAVAALRRATGPDARVVADGVPGNPEGTPEILRALEVGLDEDGLAPEARDCGPDEVFATSRNHGPGQPSASG